VVVLARAPIEGGGFAPLQSFVLVRVPQDSCHSPLNVTREQAKVATVGSISTLCR
jgi:hypothetical protein